MTRTPYDEPATATEMSADCRVIEETLRRPAPSIRYEDYPREVAKPTIRIDDTTSRLAAAIHPYLD